MCSMMMQLRREQSNVCGHRGLLLSSDQQTYSFLVPRNVRIVYDKLIASLQQSGVDSTAKRGSGLEFKFVDQHLERTAFAYHNINRFLGAFIDHVNSEFQHYICIFLMLSSFWRRGWKIWTMWYRRRQSLNGWLILNLVLTSTKVKKSIFSHKFIRK